MDSTIRVLKQTKYHLDNMIKKANEKNFEEFDFELTSFISSGRNVTFTMQKEYKGDSNFDNWYLGKQKEMRADPVLKFFNEKRIGVIHKAEKGNENFVIQAFMKFTSLDKPTAITGIAFPPDIFSNPESKAFLQTKGGEIIWTEPRVIVYVPVFQELGNRPVIETCQEYYEKLKKIQEDLSTLLNKDKL